MQALDSDIRSKLKIILAFVFVVFILVAGYFSVIKFTEKSEISPRPLTVEEKEAVLKELSKTSNSNISVAEKAIILRDLANQRSTTTISAEEKLKILQSLKK